MKTCIKTPTQQEKQAPSCCSNESLQDLRLKKPVPLQNSSKVKIKTDYMELGESSFIQRIRDKDFNKELYSRFNENFKKIIVDDEGNYLYTKVSKDFSKEISKESPNKREFLMNNRDYSNFIERKIAELGKGRLNLEKSIENSSNSTYFLRKSLKKSLDSPLKRKKKISKEFINSLKDDAYKKMSDFLNLKNKTDVLASSKRQIETIVKEYSLIIEKLTKENQILQDEAAKMKINLEETVELSDFLKRKNVLLAEQLQNIQLKYEEQLNKTSELELFGRGLRVLQEKFPGFTLEKLMNRYAILEETALGITRKLSEIEDENKKLEHDKAKERQKTQEKMLFLIENEKKKEKELQEFQIRLNNQKFDKDDALVYKERYFLVCNRVISLFNTWNSKIRVFYNTKDQQEDHNMVLDDPINVLDILDKMVMISTPESLQSYLRKIIIAANKLQRKHFKKFVNERFDPEKLFERIDKRMEILQKNRGDTGRSKTQERKMEKIFLE